MIAIYKEMALHDPDNWDIEEALKKDGVIGAEDLSEDAQSALFLFNVLPDKIDSMSGSWLGKEFAGLLDLMTIYNMSNHRDVFDLLLVCIHEAGEHYENQRKINSQKGKQ